MIEFLLPVVFVENEPVCAVSARIIGIDDRQYYNFSVNALGVNRRPLYFDGNVIVYILEESCSSVDVDSEREYISSVLSGEIVEIETIRDEEFYESHVVSLTGAVDFSFRAAHERYIEQGGEQCVVRLTPVSEDFAYESVNLQSYMWRDSMFNALPISAVEVVRNDVWILMRRSCDCVENLGVSWIIEKYDLDPSNFHLSYESGFLPHN